MSNYCFFNFRVAELPEALPKIDFAEYRRRITDSALVDEYEKLVINKYILL